MNRPYLLNDIITEAAKKLPHLTLPKIENPGEDGRTRLDILKDKLKNSQPIDVIVKGNELTSKQVVMDINDPTVKAIAYSKTLLQFTKLVKGNSTRMQPVFVDTDGENYSVTDIVKTAEFGGKGAASATTKTIYQELGQCLVTALAAAKGGVISDEDITESALAVMLKQKPGNVTISRKRMVLKFKNNVLTSHSDDEIKKTIQFVLNNESWRASMISISNKLMKLPNRSTKVNLKSTKLFYHRNSDWNQKVSEMFKKLNKESDYIFGKTSGEDKWNPADIWITSEESPDIPDASSFDEFNKWLLTEFKAGRIIPVSLKKTDTSPQLDVYNLNPDQLTDLLKTSVKQMILTKTNNLVSSKDTTLVYESADVSNNSIFEHRFFEGKESGDVEFRAQQSSIADISGEISGAKAKHGKVGFAIMNKVLVSVGLEEMMGAKYINSVYLSKIRSPNKKKKQLIDMIYASALKVNPRLNVIPVEEIAVNDPKLTIAKLISKFQAIEILRVIHENRRRKGRKPGTTKAQDILHELVKYASSRSPDSSVHLKVW